MHSFDYFAKRLLSTASETILYYQNLLWQQYIKSSAQQYIKTSAIISGNQHDDILLPKKSSHIISIRMKCVIQISLTNFSIYLID